MARIAFSSLACPEWPIERVVDAAAQWGYAGVELRSFGTGSTRFACDPAMTGGHKLRRLFMAAGVEPAGVATGLALDDPVCPPVVGHLLSKSWACVDEGRSYVEIAKGLGAPHVRLFGFHVPKVPFQSRRGTLKRIAGRAARLANACRHHGVNVLMENGGDFGSAHDLIEIVNAAGHPGVRACYDIAAGVSAGDDPVQAVRDMSDALDVVRIRDRKGDNPVELGTGELPNQAVVAALARQGFTGWLVYEWERAWIDGLASPELVLPKAAQTLSSWLGAGDASAHSAA
ncbi:MAG: sugar phosphate isomerase/epimerase [Phycisphaerales bacterium]|nr:sugar phosphate isomerase/epimerase [Phycisphaerales bacterium]